MSSARQTVEVAATVREALPNGLYRVELKDASRRSVTAHASGGGVLLRLLPGEEVVVALMPYDTSRGRIVRRAK